MRYPVLIEAGSSEKAWGVVVPDLPGCFSAGDSLEEAMENAEEAVAAWIDAVLDAGGVIPAPSQGAGMLRAKKGWALAYIDVDPALMDDTIERVNITLPRRILRRIDAKANAVGESRSSYIARMAVD
jgi:predicted RNase H-like HicB family nuclease